MDGVFCLVELVYTHDGLRLCPILVLTLNVLILVSDRLGVLFPYTCLLVFYLSLATNLHDDFPIQSCVSGTAIVIFSLFTGVLFCVYIFFEALVHVV